MTHRTIPIAFARPKQVRRLWRMQGPDTVAAAALYEHPAGTELRVYLEPESADAPLHTETHPFDVGVLEEKAAQMRALLLAKGWRIAPPTD